MGAGMSPARFPQHVIAKKRDGRALDRGEIADFVRGATDGSWADYQLSAMLMAIFLRGMTAEETAALTDAMMRSGTMADLASVRLPKVDKHSTGGVGDKVSLVLAPLMAACGIAVPMVSGRGLGHTGGTLDKLESIPGFQVNLSLEEYRRQLERIGLALIGQTEQFVPADRKLYALRDVTATSECQPLICASIMAKKLAEGIDALVLDVKFGAGALLVEKAAARELARAMVAIGRAMNKPTRAVLTAMDQPLGRTVGNGLEVAEAIVCLRGNGPADVMAVTYALGEQMLLMAGVAGPSAESRKQLEANIANGRALDKFRELVAAQKGDPRVVDDPARFLAAARHQVNLVSRSGGIVQAVDAKGVALAALRLGAGRARAEDKIDPAVGVSQLVKIGESVPPNGVLATLHANDDAALPEAKARLETAIVLGVTPAKAGALIGEVIE